MRIADAAVRMCPGQDIKVSWQNTQKILSGAEFQDTYPIRAEERVKKDLAREK